MWTNTSDDNVVIHELESGNRAIIKRSPPAGFWKIHYERGETPDILKSSFTELDKAEAVLKAYLAQKPRPTKIVEKKKEA